MPSSSPRAAPRPSQPRRVLKTLRPGQPGTLRLLRRYGEQLVCVRYREDALGRTRFTTVELVVDSGPMTHGSHRDTLVTVRLPTEARRLREQAVALGARWDEASQAWRMPWHVAKALDLDSRAQTRRPRKGSAGRR